MRIDLKYELDGYKPENYLYSQHCAIMSITYDSPNCSRNCKYHENYVTENGYKGVRCNEAIYYMFKDYLR